MLKLIVLVKTKFIIFRGDSVPRVISEEADKRMKTGKQTDGEVRVYRGEETEDEEEGEEEEKEYEPI